MSNKPQLVQSQKIVGIMSPPVATNQRDMIKNAVNKSTNNSISKKILQMISKIIENESSNERLSDIQILEKLISNDPKNNCLSKQNIAYARKMLKHPKIDNPFILIVTFI